MFRRSVGRRGPGVMGAVATTAVVGGVAASSARHATQRTMAEQQQAQQLDQVQAQQTQLAAQQQALAQQPPPPSPTPPPVGMTTDAKIASLEKLGRAQQGSLAAELAKRKPRFSARDGKCWRYRWLISI